MDPPTALPALIVTLPATLNAHPPVRKPVTRTRSSTSAHVPPLASVLRVIMISAFVGRGIELLDLIQVMRSSLDWIGAGMKGGFS